MHNKNAFQGAYKKLNKAQKKAVDTIEGPVMVVAGPGTGKTQILTLRIANIVKKTDTRPENILALTFTESGIASMRKRLLEIIGSAAYSIAIFTFHGFCNDVIMRFSEHFPRIVGSRPITDVDELSLISSLIEKESVRLLRPFGDPLHYVRDIQTAIRDIKREGVDPDAFEKLLARERKAFAARDDLYHEKGTHKGKMKGEAEHRRIELERNQELALLYHGYEKELTRRRMYDFADMIMEVLRELQKNKELLLMLQETYQYFLIDEHQDTNTAQNKIIELLASFHPNPNVFIVGDEKQAIYRFQGASLENFRFFKKLYPKAELIVLEENYRSTQAVLDAAENILKSDKKLKSSLDSVRDKQTRTAHPIRRAALSSPEAEAYFIARDIANRISAGVRPEEIAVLYRENRDAEEFAVSLRRLGVPFVVESDQNILSDPDIQKLLLLFHLTLEPGSTERLAEVLHIDFLALSPIDVFRLLEFSARRRRPLFEILRERTLLRDAKIAESKKFTAFLTRLESWARIARNQPLLEAFEMLVRESGLLAHLLSHAKSTRGEPVESIEKLAALNRLFDEAQALVAGNPAARLADFMRSIDTLLSHHAFIKKTAPSRPGAVRLMTAHRAKGLEFEHVYIVKAFDGHWGNKRVRNPFVLPNALYSASGAALAPHNENDDERRLFYVALTRARASITITYSLRSASGRDQLPSQFLEELRPELIEVFDTVSLEKKMNTNPTIRFSEPAKREPPQKRRVIGPSNGMKAFVRTAFINRGLSATALNNYLECPWRYFYSNLLRLPQAKTKHQMYGTAVHTALKDFFDALRAGKLPARTAAKKFLLARFARALEKEPLLAADFKESLEKGQRALTSYYDAYKGSFAKNTVTEFFIPGIVLAPDIRITGKIDKLEFIGGERAVNVVDYKTSKPKTRGELEGRTKTATGNEKRQLVFYNLLLNKFEDGSRFQMTSGEIDFVEPDVKGRYKKERFLIDTAEVDELEAEIIAVSSDILSLSFWNNRCDEKDCEYCRLRNMINNH